MSKFSLSGIAKSFLREGKDTWKYAYMPNEDNPESLSDSEKKKGYEMFLKGVVDSFYEQREEEKDFNPKVTEDEIENLVMKYADMEEETYPPNFLEKNKNVLDMLIQDVMDEIPSDPFAEDDYNRRMPGTGYQMETKTGGGTIDTYYKSYSGAIQAAIEHAEKRGYEVDQDDVDSQITFAYPGRPKKDNEYVRAIIGLTKNGKPQKKALTIVVTFLKGKSKPYELVTYIN